MARFIQGDRPEAGAELAMTWLEVGALIFGRRLTIRQARRPSADRGLP
jgi:hypothetical protein